MSVIPRTKARNALKREEILVSGRVALRGSDILEPGTKFLCFRKRRWPTKREAEGAPKGKDRNHASSQLRAPFPVVYEDNNVFIYEKPAGWVCASPNPKVKTTYSAVKAYLEAKTEAMVDVHFVNKLPREASGLLVVAKSLAWRQHLQTNWASFAKGMYVMVQGHLPADDELFLRPEQGEPYALPYRTMRATNLHTMLKFRAGYEVIKDMLPALRREDCLLMESGSRRQTPSREEASICLHLPWWDQGR